MFASLQPGPLDMATQAALPLLAVPLDSPFEELAAPGRRILVAQDGLYLEARSPSMYVRVRLSEHQLPYGRIGDRINLASGPIPRAIARQLKDLALTAHPKEMAALVLSCSASTGEYWVHQPCSTATGGSVSYLDRGYDESMLVLDVHSHGHYGACFSATDDLSDQSRIGPHISLVFGHCATREGCEISARVCIGSHLIPLSTSTLECLFA